MAKKEQTVQENITIGTPEEAYAVELSLTDEDIERLEKDEQEQSTALVPVVDQDIDIYVKQQTFQAGRARRIMQTSYTGAEKISIDDLDQVKGVRGMHVQGCYVQTVNERVVNEKTGEVKDSYQMALFKLTDGRVISAGGKMAIAFAHELIEDLGEFDWPEPLKIIVRQHKGKNFEYPNFQVIE